MYFGFLRRFFCKKCIVSFLADQSDTVAGRSQSQIGIVLSQKQAVFRTAGHHSVGFVGSLGDQVVNQRADIAVGALQDHRFFMQNLKGGIDAGNQALRCGFLIPGGILARHGITVGIEDLGLGQPVPQLLEQAFAAGFLAPQHSLNLRRFIRLDLGAGDIGHAGALGALLVHPGDGSPHRVGGLRHGHVGVAAEELVGVIRMGANKGNGQFLLPNGQGAVIFQQHQALSGRAEGQLPVAPVEEGAVQFLPLQGKGVLEQPCAELGCEHPQHRLVQDSYVRLACGEEFFQPFAVGVLAGQLHVHARGHAPQGGLLHGLLHVLVLVGVGYAAVIADCDARKAHLLPQQPGEQLPGGVDRLPIDEAVTGHHAPQPTLGNGRLEGLPVDFLQLPGGGQAVGAMDAPLGVVKGQNLQNLFSDLTIGYHDSVDFNSFLIPFACVAVDMVSGKDYVFHKGSLPLAMRASMAIPAVFTPVRLDSMVLVDGGLNNNYPVDVALAMGADIVIGVDLATSDLRSYDRLHSPGDIATQIIALHGYDKYERNRDRTDLLFRPDMEPYRSSSFAPAALDTMLHRGEADARRRWNEIMALKRRIGLSDTDTFSIQSRRLAHRPVLPADTFYVRHIRFDGADPRDLNWLHRICALKENSHITLKELRKSMSILVGTNAYAYVNYKLTGESQQDLVLTLQPKSESSVNLGIRFDSEEIIGVLVNATYHKGKRNHSRFAFTGRVGSKISSAMLDYSIERSPLRNFNLSYKFSYNNLDIYEKGDKRFNTTYTHHLAEFAYSDMNWLSFKVKAGLRYEYFNYNSFLYTGSDELYTVKPEGFFSYFASAHLETLDRRYFPNRGVSLEADYSLYTDNFVKYNGSSPFSAIGSL